MPFYNVEHSYPLDLKQKNALAEKITYLHSRAFGAPSIFVQVKYFPVDASSDTHYVGGVIQHDAANRIIAYVRSSSSRTQEQFDQLAEQIENAWYVVLGERAEDGEESKDKKESSAIEQAAKELLSIGFVPGLSGREKGFIIPTVRVDCVCAPVMTRASLTSFRRVRKRNGSNNTRKIFRGKLMLATKASKLC